MLGLGDAILTGMPLIGNETFAVILADDLCHSQDKGVLSQLIEIYNKYKCTIIAIEEVPMDKVNKYGIISGKLLDENKDIYQVTKMIEKPKVGEAPSNLAIIGRYILTPDIFDILKDIKPDKNNEIQITEALNILAQNGKVLAYKFKGRRFDCGDVKGFVSATNYFASKLI